MELKITLSNAKELKSAFLKAPAIATEEYRTALDTIATTVQRKAILAAPVNSHISGGGTLRQSIKKLNYSPSGFIVWVNADYGVFVDQGTKPHVILPKNKRFLAFKGSDGNWVRTKRINHPGQKPTYFFSNAVEEGQRIADAEMSSAMDRVLSRL